MVGSQTTAVFDNEAALVRAFVEQLQSQRSNVWTVYPETAGWDLLLVHKDGFQLGVEAKLILNAKVIEQALDGAHSYWHADGPDYRAVLVPEGKVQRHFSLICRMLGIGIITIATALGWRMLNLPSEEYGQDWPNWCPAKRCELPDYIPDVEGGHSAPVALTPWKVKAIKLLILLERRGVVTRGDMKTLQLSPTRWTDAFHGFLDRDPARGGFVRNDRTPDLRAQHPRNFAEIEADFDTWAKNLNSSEWASPAELFGRSA